MPIPKIFTGPTKGQFRSRNSNGRWRAKRSDTGIKRKIDDGNSKTLLIGAGVIIVGAGLFSPTIPILAISIGGIAYFLLKK